MVLVPIDILRYGASGSIYMLAAKVNDVIYIWILLFVISDQPQNCPV